MSLWSSRPSSLRHQTDLARGEMLAMISAIMALMAMGIDMLLPAFDDIRDAYDLSGGSSQAGQTITIFFLGLAVGQLFFGPLADRYGRKATLYGAMAVYVVAAIGSACSLVHAAANNASVTASTAITDRWSGSARSERVLIVLLPVGAGRRDVSELPASLAQPDDPSDTV